MRQLYIVITTFGFIACSQAKSNTSAECTTDSECAQDEQCCPSSADLGPSCIKNTESCDSDAGDSTDGNDGTTSGPIDCSVPLPPEACQTFQLVDNTLWETVSKTEDPFYEEVDPPHQICDPETYGPELEGDITWFSVVTADCNYVTVEQPLQHDVPKGALLRVRLWHFKITQTVGQYRHAIAIGTPPETLWESTLDVPTLSGGLLPYDYFEAPRDMKKGEVLYWHVDNHGQNSWHLIEVSALHAP